MSVIEWIGFFIALIAMIVLSARKKPLEPLPDEEEEERVVVRPPPPQPKRRAAVVVTAPVVVAAVNVAKVESTPPSRIQTRLRRLPSKRDMLIWQEVMSPPKAFREKLTRYE